MMQKQAAMQSAEPGQVSGLDHGNDGAAQIRLESILRQHERLDRLVRTQRTLVAATRRRVRAIV